jgi:hypothetical protein
MWNCIPTILDKKNSFCMYRAYLIIDQATGHKVGLIKFQRIWTHSHSLAIVQYGLFELNINIKGLIKTQNIMQF